MRVCEAFLANISTLCCTHTTEFDDVFTIFALARLDARRLVVCVMCMLMACVVCMCVYLIKTNKPHTIRLCASEFCLCAYAVGTMRVSIII